MAAQVILSSKGASLASMPKKSGHKGRSILPSQVKTNELKGTFVFGVNVFIIEQTIMVWVVLGPVGNRKKCNEL